jgi:signal transduction histidine kinase
MLSALIAVRGRDRAHEGWHETMPGDVAGQASPREIELQTLARLGVLANTGSLDELFDAIAQGLAQVSTRAGASRPVRACVFRFTRSGSVTALASSDPSHAMVPTPGTQWELDGDSANGALWRSGQVSRVDGPLTPNGTISRRRLHAGVTSVVAGPVLVEGRLWGSATVFSDLDEPLPPETEWRVAAFAELAGAAVTSAERTHRLGRLLDEQAARRELAVMIADGAEPHALFDAVTAAAGRHCRAFGAGLVRFDGETASTVVSMWSQDGAGQSAPTAWPRAEDTMGGRIREAGSARVDDWREIVGPNAQVMHAHLGIGGSVAAPVFTEGRLWGIVMVHSRVGAVLPDGTESLLIGFADLITSAISSAARRAEARRLADEQAALRRIATLVASQPAPADVYRTLLDEVGRFPGVDDARIQRLSDDQRHGEVVAVWGVLEDEVPVGFVTPLETTLVLGPVLASGQVVKIENVPTYDGTWPALAERHGLVEVIGCPIFVGDRLWGALTVASRSHGGLSGTTRDSLVQGSGLIATAVANAEARENVRASRERLVTVGDATRRRIERDLHDGAQQRLVALTLDLRSSSPDQPMDPRAVASEIDKVIDDIRTIARGIHPAVLSQGGLRPALRNLARRSAVPTRLVVPPELPPMGEAVEVAVYYVVSEALTNVAKHARADEAVVTVDVPGPRQQVDVTVVDDGAGGALARPGGGLQGLADRIEALGGTLSLSSARGAGTVLHVSLPVRGRPDGPDRPAESDGSPG